MEVENQITISDSGLYAQFLLENYLEELVKETKKKVKETGIYLSEAFHSLDPDQENTFYRKSIEGLLSRFIHGTAIEWAKITLEECKKYKIFNLEDTPLNGADMLFFYSVRKQILIKFLSCFTTDIKMATSIMLEIEDFYIQWENLAFYLYSQTQEKQLEIKNQMLERANEELKKKVEEKMKDKDRMDKVNHELHKVQNDLLKINSELEERVNERTEELFKKNVELKKINHDLDNFVYTASHDLRAPICNLEGLVHALSHELETENKDALKIIEMMNISISKFKQTIKDLTEISRIQKINDDEESQINLSELLDDVKISIFEMVASSDAQILADFTACPTIIFSRKNLKSIFYNLISNAIKYKAFDRRPEIYIRAEKVGNYLKLIVEDNGLGVNLSDKNKIFGMFKRMHDHVEGSGLGLYIVKRIVENAGGKIEVLSEIGKGTTFRVYLECEK